MPYYNSHTHATQLGEKAIVQAPMQNLQIPHSIGVHPWEADQWNDTLLPSLLFHPQCRAVGEIGLDALKGPSLAIQKQVFEAQILIANAHRKPIILHVVRAWSDFYQIYAKHTPQTPWILHGFNAPKQIKEVLKRSLYIGLGPSSFENPNMLSQVSNLPKDRILLETDDSPMPISEVYLRYAEACGSPLEDVALKIEKNFLAIFGPW